jgi:UDP-glucose 4-epimerase
LITGGAGFIGSYLAEYLIARDYRVTVIDDESTGDPENLSAIRDHFQFSYIKASVADKPMLRSILSDVDEVYHLAAAVGVSLISSAPIHTIETNLYLTEMLMMELLRQHRQGRSVKLFLASSCEVYGKNNKEPLGEDDDLVLGPTSKPRWLYGASKAAAECLALAYWREHQLPVVIGRLFNVAGPRQSGRFGMVLPRLVEAAVTNQPLVVYDYGLQRRCFAHVVDVVDAMTTLMKVPTAAGQIYNIGGDEPVTILDLAKLVISIAKPGLEIQFKPFFAAYSDAELEDVRSRVPDLTKLREVINFKSAHTLDMIVREVINVARARQRR